MEELLRNLEDNSPFVGAVINGRYFSRVTFNRTRVPDQSEIQLIPWNEGMTVAELLRYDVDEVYFSAATVDGRLISEADFDKTIISKKAEVWLLPPIGGG